MASELLRTVLELLELPLSLERLLLFVVGVMGLNAVSLREEAPSIGKLSLSRNATAFGPDDLLSPVL
jgi:hypothetical protein